MYTKYLMDDASGMAEGRHSRVQGQWQKMPIFEPLSSDILQGVVPCAEYI